MNVRCYRCGRVIDASKAHRRKVTTQTISGTGGGIETSGMSSPAIWSSHQSYNVQQLVDFCEPCNTRQNEKDRQMMILTLCFTGIGLVALFLIGLVAMMTR